MVESFGKVLETANNTDWKKNNMETVTSQDTTSPALENNGSLLNPDVPEFFPNYLRYRFACSSISSTSSPSVSRTSSESSDASSVNELLWDGAKCGDCRKIRTAVEEGAELQAAANNRGSSALHLAAERGHYAAVHDLLASGADPNQLDSNGWSPLDRSVWAGRRQVAELLLANGANVNITDSINRTPLHATAIKGNLELAMVLIERGAELGVRDRKFHMTPADWAKKYKKRDVYNYLTRKSSLDLD